MANTDSMTDVEVIALTIMGEFEELGEEGMTQGVCVILNRAMANKKWMGGNNPRHICLAPLQFSCWNDSPNNRNLARMLDVYNHNKDYPPYIKALEVSSKACNGDVDDHVNGAVSYINHNECDPTWAQGKTPCFVNEPIWFFDLKAVT